jgi:hypothetical protein
LDSFVPVTSQDELEVVRLMRHERTLARCSEPLPKISDSLFANRLCWSAERLARTAAAGRHDTSLLLAVNEAIPAGGAPVHVYSEFAQTRTFWISGVMEWSLRYLTIGLDTFALVLTAALVSIIVRGELPRFRAALAELWNYPRRILGYSFTLYCMVVIFAVFVSLPTLRLLHWVTDLNATTGWSRAVNFTLTRGQSLVSLILFAWIITPVTIRLLRAPGAEPPSSDEKKLGRYLVILTGAGALALYAALLPLLFKLVALRPFHGQVYALLFSLALSLPFTVMRVIALALVAAGGNRSLGEPSPHRNWRQLVRVFMPLHFDDREER